MLTSHLVVALLSFSILLSPVEQLQPVGEARLSKLFIKIYDSTLYTATGNYEPNVYPQALSITYLLNIKKVDLIKRTREQWEKIGIYDATQSETWLTTLETMWPDRINKQDNLTLVVDAQQRSYFYHNEQLLGSFEDTAFGPQFLAIWLSPDTRYPDLRAQLIGEG